MDITSKLLLFQQHTARCRPQTVPRINSIPYKFTRLHDPTDIAIVAEVERVLAQDGHWSLEAHLNVKLPNLGQELAQKLVDDAREVCPYCRATRGNIEVDIKPI